MTPAIMDSAQQVELHALRHQEAMNQVIDNGDSPVQQFYRGAVVFVTGGTGFLGKHLIEKLFRSCAIKKMFLLSRSKKGKTIEERLQHMLTDPLYDNLRMKQPEFANLIVPVEGDVADIRLGLKDPDWHMLAEEVNVIFHLAATVRFNEPLRVATLINVRGTREVLALAKQCTNLKKLIHMSTAFSYATRDRINKELLEQFYPSPAPPQAMIAMAEEVEQTRLDNITHKLIKGWPNTYTFTKALGEELLRTCADDIPVCIVRPPIVLPAYYEPSPGWLDITTLNGPSGIFLGGCMGILNVFHTDNNAFLMIAPVDYVNNATIAAAWDSTERMKNGDKTIPVYIIRRSLRFGFVGDTALKEKDKLYFPDAVWQVDTWYIKNKYVYWLASLFLNYLPGFLLDILCIIVGKKPSGVTSFVSLFKKVDNLAAAYNYFLFNDWDFHDNNVQAMVKRMNAADKKIFNCDVATIDLYEYVLVWVIGLRKYIVKDGLKNTHIGRRKQLMFTGLNWSLRLLLGYILFNVIMKLINVLWN